MPLPTRLVGMSLLVLPYICTPLSEVDQRVTPQRDQICSLEPIKLVL